MELPNTWMNHKKTIIYVALSILIFVCFVIYSQWQNEQIKDLKEAYADNQVRLKTLQVLSQEYAKQIEEQKDKITSLQKERDKAIKEVVKNAYIKGSSIPDSDILDAWKDTIRRSSERNAERKNNLTDN